MESRPSAPTGVNHPWSPEGSPQFSPRIVSATQSHMSAGRAYTQPFTPGEPDLDVSSSPRPAALPADAGRDARAPRTDPSQQLPGDSRRGPACFSGSGHSARGLAPPCESSDDVLYTPRSPLGPLTTGNHRLQRSDGGLDGLEAKKQDQPWWASQAAFKGAAASASDYRAAEGDDVDQAVQCYARQLPRYLGECLKIMRVGMGEYVIGTDHVHMAWDKYPISNGTFHKEVFVTRPGRTHNDDESPGEPLPEYLRLCANVAYDLKCSMNNIPLASRLTFEEAGTALFHGDAEAKLDAMMVATRQARMRQQAADEWRKHNQYGPLQSHDTSSLSDSICLEDPPIIEVERDVEVDVMPTNIMPVQTDGSGQVRAHVPREGSSQGQVGPRFLSGDVSRLCRPGPIVPVSQLRLGSGLDRLDASPLSRLMSSPTPRQLPPELVGTPR